MREPEAAKALEDNWAAEESKSLVYQGKTLDV
jgi:hypothetical protein